MDEQSHVVPYDLEEPTPIMFWHPMEFVMAMTLLGFGVVTNLWVLGALGAAGVLVGSRYLKRGAKKGAMQHLLWAMGLQLDAPLARTFKASWLNDFVE